MGKQPPMTHFIVILSFNNPKTFHKNKICIEINCILMVIDGIQVLHMRKYTNVRL